MGSWSQGWATDTVQFGHLGGPEPQEPVPGPTCEGLPHALGERRFRVDMAFGGGAETWIRLGAELAVHRASGALRQDLRPHTRQRAVSDPYLFEEQDRARGPALVKLSEFFQAQGYTIDAGELPDYLPLLLEYVSTLPDEQGARQFLHQAVEVAAVCGMPELSWKHGFSFSMLLTLLAALLPLIYIKRKGWLR